MKQLALNQYTNGAAQQKGYGLIEILVALSLLSVVLLGSVYHGLQSLKMTRACVWDTEIITSFSTFFERSLRHHRTEQDQNSMLQAELSLLNQSLKIQSPNTEAEYIIQEDQLLCSIKRKATGEPGFEIAAHI